MWAARAAAVAALCISSFGFCSPAIRGTRVSGPGFSVVDEFSRVTVESGHATNDAWHTIVDEIRRQCKTKKGFYLRRIRQMDR
jgi:hypothetical protein